MSRYYKQLKSLVRSMNGLLVEHRSVHSIGGGFDSYFRLSFHSVQSQGGIS